MRENFVWNLRLRERERKLVTLESLALSNFRATLVYGMNWINRNIGLRLVLHGSCAER
ncbi:MAG: hypothetical protein ACTS45_00720 [Candidatus Hodgkinia cicadicola]